MTSNFPPDQQPYGGHPQHYAPQYTQQFAPQHTPQYPVQNVPMTPPRKEPFFSLLISFFIPGLGTILNGEGRKGGIIMGIAYLLPVVAIVGAFLYGVLFTLAYAILPNSLSPSFGYGFTGRFFLIFGAIPLMIGAWIWGLIDAYKGAEAHNARYGLN